MIVRLFRYLVALGREAEFTSMLRSRSAADGELPAGFIAAWDGRRLGRESQEYVSVSIWVSPEARRAARGDGPVPPHLEPLARLLRTSESEDWLVVGEPILRRGGRVLRVFSVAAEDRPDPLRTEDSLARVTQRLRGDRGPASLVMAVEQGTELPVAASGEQPPQAVRGVAVSTWRSWEDVLAATGARASRPIVEEIADRRRTLEHYDLMTELAAFAAADEE